MTLYDNEAVANLMNQYQRLPERERAYIMVELVRCKGNVERASTLLQDLARSEQQKRQFALVFDALQAASEIVT